MPQDRQITLDEIAKGIDTGLTTADLQRGTALERLDTTRQAKDTSLRREQARLSEKYGADHPRVQAISNKVVINQVFRQQVAVETVRARTEIPIVDQDTWIFHGFVRNLAQQGVPNLTVALYDPGGNRLNNLGQACTEANGYFKVVSKDANSIGSSAAYVRVLTGSTFLYAGKDPLLPKLGRLDYREITLSGETAVCVSPPEPPTGSTSKPGDTWVVNGRVTNANGEGLKDLTVSVYDKDFTFDDRLGQVQTGEGGYYTLSYHTKDFRDLIESNPDIYLKVLDQGGKLLYSSKETIRFEAGRVETIDVVIPGDVVPATQSDDAPLRTPTDVWQVDGHVTDIKGTPLEGYLVIAMDKDTFSRDDELGTSTTDSSGYYRISYRTRDFSFIESKPDIYLKVKDPSGTLVYTSKQVWFGAGRMETIDVVIGKR
jgi:hypothetical protein